MLEATGNEDKIDAIISMVRPFGVREIARTGRVALAREIDQQGHPVTGNPASRMGAGTQADHRRPGLTKPGRRYGTRQDHRRNGPNAGTA